MEIFGIGPLELVLIVLVAIIVLGPKEMLSSAQKAAEWLRKLRKSDAWTTTKEVMDIPKQVMKETGLDKEIREIQNLSSKTFSPSAWDPNELISNTINKPSEQTKAQTQTPDVPESLPTPDAGEPNDIGSKDKP